LPGADRAVRVSHCEAAGDTLDVVVIGAGVVGLAVARALAGVGREVVVLEAAPAIGTHTSSRNSEVIHAGIYYPQGSLKARLCVAGKQALYAYCAARGVSHRRVGKLIVAVNHDQMAALEQHRQRAVANGVTDLEWLDRAAVARLEPAVRCVGALLSPSTGIIDSHAFMSALRADLEQRGGRVLLATPVLGGQLGEDGHRLRVGGAEPLTVRCRAIVNCAGLFAQEVAQALAGLPAASIPARHFCKGSYFVLGGAAPFRRLIYPVPVPGGLGIHVTLDLAGTARFGPDVEWVDGIDYAIDDRRAEAFYAAIRTYYPGLPDGGLHPGYTGIRPKLGPAGAAAADFAIQGHAQHGVRGLVNLYGIESPGLTASLAIADVVVEELR
jgi:L-2-hydroxyglutarate oxidase LhgO